MQNKRKYMSSTQQSQIKVQQSSASSRINFNSDSIQKQLKEVKEEIKTVIENSHVDSNALSLSFN